jgi:hypothetical protein
MGGRYHGLFNQLQHQVTPGVAPDDLRIGANQPVDATTKKAVCFSSRVAIRRHTSRQDMTPEEIQDAWFSGEEFTTIMQSCTKQIRMINQGQRLRDAKYCSRGLESHTRIPLALKQKTRADAFHVVLDEQDLQLERSVFDDEAIRAAYVGVTRSSQLWAHTVGLRDQREAERILDVDLCNVESTGETPNGVRDNSSIRFQEPLVASTGKQMPKTKSTKPTLEKMIVQVQRADKKLC